MVIFLFRNLKLVLKCSDVQQVDASGGHVFHTRQGISWSDSQLLAAKEKLCFVVVRINISN